MEVWVFGYGSLVWRPAFAYAERRAGFVRGWKRRFWQGSTDHRGVPGRPGRVVTLLPAEDETVHGVAYRLPVDQQAEILQGLDVREQGGYDRFAVDVFPHTPGHAPIPALVYVATPENPNYLGPAALDEIAHTVQHAHGPSGPNLEYALSLADALREMRADDPHVFELEALLRELA